ncbi:hypothetical protein DBR32_14735 [Taibaiella sp. KBW10]|uniref:hypothetical protein n=1 Tax=Taibaiella sp. KBW10 TaxID=2153357 RepID=UPI000F59392C|nr:hypothetical protein [Taibaiella sp. KBW10]RQO29837.1 hypothetical protein DBR32_14735 [Taibaiella sp. KBW10]
MNTNGSEVPILFAGGLIDANDLKQIVNDIKQETDTVKKMLQYLISNYPGAKVASAIIMLISTRKTTR